jgi:transcriptional regulator GlxA family with amidase domain
MSSGHPRLVVFSAYEGMRILDLTGPLDAFALANDLHGSDGPAPYLLRVVSVHGGPVRTSSGLALVTESLASLEEAAIDTLIVAGGAAELRANSTPLAVQDWLETQSELVEWIARRGGPARRLCSVCTGTFLLAAGGLLAEREVATHWAVTQLLGNCFPHLRVQPDRIFVRDGPVWTSGGVTAGIDLALALIEDDFGGELARQVARVMVTFVARQGGQAQYSVPFAAQLSDRSDFTALHAWLSKHLADDLRIDVLAARISMSRRTFMRTYVAATGRTPAKTIEAMRIDAARVALEATRKTLKEIAREAGFGTEDRMRGVFQRSLGVSPADYRLRFSLRHRGPRQTRPERGNVLN